jgi:hypothetical protein
MNASVQQAERSGAPPIGLRRKKTNGSASHLHTPLTTEDRKMFASLRIDPQLLESAGVCRVDTTQANQLGFQFKPHADLSGIFFPYCDAAGRIQNGRIRRDHPELNSKGEPENKYISMPSGRARLLYGLPDTTELLNHPETEVVLVEAEKSALAITSAARRTGRKLVALALGGCWGWREKKWDAVTKKEYSVAIDDIETRRGRKAHVMLDANASWNSEVQRAELELCAHLSTIGATFVCHRIPVEPGVNGPDDYLAKHPDRDFCKLLDSPVEPWLAKVGESYEQYAAAKPPEFVIKDFLQSSGLTIVAGLSGHGKTWLLLSVVQSLLTGEKLFGDFAVFRKSSRVLYLSPEITLGSLRVRAEKFGLGSFVQSGQLIVRTLSAYPMIELTDPALLLSVRGADVFLDTAVRFMDGDESSSTDNDRGLANAIFRLFQSGARTVTAAHHSPKGFQNQNYMSLETVLRGTGDIGAMSATAWGVRMLNAEQTLLHVENLKARDFAAPPSFQLLGRPSIDEGKGLRMSARPGECGRLAEYLNPKNTGRPKSAEKEDRKALLVQWVKEKRTKDECAGLLAERGIKIALGTLKKEYGEARRLAKIT